jgi:hypothetical protein
MRATAVADPDDNRREAARLFIASLPPACRRALAERAADIVAPTLLAARARPKGRDRPA